MRCINFDREFERYLAEWIKANKKNYRTYDDMEDAMPQVYAAFLDTPVNWLGGMKPGEYFGQFDKPLQLVNWMEDYFKQRVPVPDMLLNRIAELGLSAQDALMGLLNKAQATREMKMAAVTLLREIGSEAPLDLYVGWQAARQEGEDELADNALDSLDSMGEKAVEAMRRALPDATAEGKEALLSLLANFPGDEAVFQEAMALFQARRDRAPLMADCLRKLGDERALPAMQALAASEETPYLDYIELRNAIEALGGDAPIREFDAEDPAYEAMRRMQ